MERKYEFTGETSTITVKSYPDACEKVITLHRIRATRTFTTTTVPGFYEKCVETGTLGGWIEKEKNLSHDGNAWVADEAIVCDDAIVRENAVVYKYACVSGISEIIGHTLVGGAAWIEGNVFVCDGVVMDGRVHVSGYNFLPLVIEGSARIMNRAEIFSSNHVATVGPIQGDYGQDNDIFTFYRDMDNEISVTDGRSPYLLPLKLNVFLREMPKHSKQRRVRRAAAELAKLQIDLEGRFTE